MSRGLKLLVALTAVVAALAALSGLIDTLTAYKASVGRYHARLAV